jgi:hypothetical protein
MDNEQTTSEVIELLGEDCDRSHEELIAVIDAGNRDAEGNIEADYEYKAR